MANTFSYVTCLVSMRKYSSKRTSLSSVRSTLLLIVHLKLAELKRGSEDFTLPKQVWLAGAGHRAYCCLYRFRRTRGVAILYVISVIAELLIGMEQVGIGVFVLYCSSLT